MQSFCFASLDMQTLWRCGCRRVVYLKLFTMAHKGHAANKKRSPQTKNGNVYFANYRFSFRKLQIFISYSSHFGSFHFVSQTTVSLDGLELGSSWFSSILMWAENADENMQRKKQFVKFMVLKIEEDKHVYVIYIFVTLPFRTEVILECR